MNEHAEASQKTPTQGDPHYNREMGDFEVVACWPHSDKSFTEGLVIRQGFLFESTGGDKLNPPPSSLQRLKLRSAEVLNTIWVNEDYFAEGLTILDGRIFQLTERSRLGLIYDLNNLNAPPSTFDYNGWDLGWGITNDGNSLIISDTTDKLHFVDPDNFKVTRSIALHYQNGKRLDSLNELEYVNGLIYANIYPLDSIARICPREGTVIDLIDVHELRPDEPDSGVTNGIAYDDESGHLFVTGKMWPTIYEICSLREPL